MALRSLNLFCLMLFLLLSTSPVLANVEKVIFIGPNPANIPLAKPTLSDLRLHTLTPETPSVRTNLSRVFPAIKGDALHGHSAWLLLDDLNEGQRYELRVCWAAIEPTSFTLDVFELDTVWQTPELIQSLAGFATSRQTDEDTKPHKPSSGDVGERKASVLLLRVRAAADYFTDDMELMHHPPPVLVDLILDPFLYNIVPRSLVPTAGYLVLVGAVTWIVARWIASSLQSVAGVPGQTNKQD